MVEILVCTGFMAWFTIRERKNPTALAVLWGGIAVAFVLRSVLGI